jgi:hypothetical protein
MSTTLEASIKSSILEGVRDAVLTDINSIMAYLEANNPNYGDMTEEEVYRVLRSMFKTGQVTWNGRTISLLSKNRRLPYGFGRRMDRNPPVSSKRDFDVAVYKCERCPRRHTSRNMALWYAEVDESECDCDCDDTEVCLRCAPQRVCFNPRIATASVVLATFDIDDLGSVAPPSKPICMPCAAGFDSDLMRFTCYNCDVEVKKAKLGVVVTPIDGGDSRRWEHATLLDQTRFLDMDDGCEMTLCLDCCYAALFGTRVLSG